MTQKHLSTLRPLEIEERDQAGHVVTRYIASFDDSSNRIDISVRGGGVGIVATWEDGLIR
jgi:hypothetical protein